MLIHQFRVGVKWYFAQLVHTPPHFSFHFIYALSFAQAEVPVKRRRNQHRVPAILDFSESSISGDEEADEEQEWKEADVTRCPSMRKYLYSGTFTLPKSKDEQVRDLTFLAFSVLRLLCCLIKLKFSCFHFTHTPCTQVTLATLIKTKRCLMPGLIEKWQTRSKKITKENRRQVLQDRQTRKNLYRYKPEIMCEI